MPNNNHVLFLGYGFTARHIASLLPSDWQVNKTNRSGMNGCITFDGTKTIELPKNITHVVHSIAPTKQGVDVVYEQLLSQLQNVPHLKWVGYISSISVYGDAGDAWVNEAYPTKPTTDYGKRRVIVEQLWQDSGLPVTCFRAAGIYGVERNILHAIKAGRAQRIDAGNHVTNRIHVQDLAWFIAYNMQHKIPEKIFNVSDGNPAPQHEVVKYGCELLGIKPPLKTPFDQAVLSDMACAIYSQQRKIDNSAMLSYITPQYADYKKGLDACLANS